MKTPSQQNDGALRFGRRSFLKSASGAALLTLAAPKRALAAGQEEKAASDLFWVRDIPSDPFTDGGPYHAGIEAMLTLMARQGLKFYRTGADHGFGGHGGLIAPDDVVVVKVNAQWKYRGCTNSDLVRGLVQRILDHPDGFTGEVLILDNGQGRGSMACKTSAMYNGDASIQANANNRRHHFLYLARQVFGDKPVYAMLLDPIRETVIGNGDHDTDGYRQAGLVSYPCFTTPGGRRVELREGIWTGSGYKQNLKLINVPVLKHHDEGGSEITGALKNMYGLLSMADGYSRFRHYKGLGATCGRMFANIRAPVLNLVDAIWVSQASISGHPEESTSRQNQLMASQDPVALDYCAARKILQPIDGNPRHDPRFAGIRNWLAKAAKIINDAGGLSNPRQGLYAGKVTLDEAAMRVYETSAT